MLRELLKTKRRFESQGFALPTVMIVSVVMMIILVTAVQASASVRTALSNQYYNNLAAEAAEAGIMFAHACIQNKDGYASWNQLQPDTDCNGNGINGLPNGRYLIKRDGDMRTTFNVSATSSVDADPYNLTVTGSVQLLRKSSPTNPWKTITVKKKMTVRPCSKTVTNLISNPSFETNTTGWTPYSGTNIAAGTNAAAPPLTDGKNTLYVQSTGSNESFAETPLALQPGKTYTVSGVLHRPGSTWNNSGAHSRRLSIAVFAALSSGGYFEALAQVASTEPGHRRTSATFTIPSNATTTFMRLYNGATSDIVYWDSIMLTEGSTDYPYRDGDAPGWAWNGAFNNSQSIGPVKTACSAATPCTQTNLITNPNFETNHTTDITSQNVTNARVTQAANPTEWKKGLASIKTTPLSGSNGDAYVSIGGDNGALRLGMEPGKTYTLSATMYLPSSNSGSFYLPYRFGVVAHVQTPGAGYNFYTATPYNNFQYNQSTEVTNSTVSFINMGEYRLSTTFTIPPTSSNAFIRLYNGSTQSQPATVYWDNVALYEGVAAPYYDSTDRWKQTYSTTTMFQAPSAAGYYDGDSTNWAWSSTPNLSTSSGPVVPCNAPISY